MRCLRGDRSPSRSCCFLTLLLLFGCFVYPIYLRHTALAAFLFIALVRIRAERDGGPGEAIRSLVVVGNLRPFHRGTDLFVPFDSAACRVDHPPAEARTEAVVFLPSVPRHCSLRARAGSPSGSEQRCASQFGRWNFRTHIENRAQLYAALRSAERTYGSFYFVTDLPNVLPATLGSRIARVSAVTTDNDTSFGKSDMEMWRTCSSRPAFRVLAGAAPMKSGHCVRCAILRLGIP